MLSAGLTFTLGMLWPDQKRMQQSVSTTAHAYHKVDGARRDCSANFCSRAQHAEHLGLPQQAFAIHPGDFRQVANNSETQLKLGTAFLGTAFVLCLRRCQMREDGSVPTLATRSSIYVMGLGKKLGLDELAILTLGSVGRSDWSGIWFDNVQLMIDSTTTIPSPSPNYKFYNYTDHNIP